MAHPLRALDMLLRLKRRRIDQLNDAIAAQQQAVAQADAAWQQARANETACRQEEHACAEKIEVMTGGPRFKPSDLLVLRHVREGLADLVRRAEVQTAQALQALQAQQQTLNELQQALKRAEHQLERLLERRARCAAELDAAQEDAQDEDSEEAAVARMLAGMATDDVELSTVSPKPARLLRAGRAAAVVNMNLAAEARAESRA